MRLRLALVAAMLAVGLLPIVVLARTLADLPDPRALMAAAPPPSTLIYDRNGVLLYEMLAPGAARSTPVDLDRVPPYLRLATLATEDAEFYRHPGVDGRAILRAAYYNLRYGRVVSGGSTITQQVARNLLLRGERDERSLRRKAREALLALLIERRYSKDDILELYLNTTDYGRQATGVEAAAQAFFGKPVATLDLAESAFLAGLPQAPSLYDPTVGDAWQERRRTVLGLMARRGFVTEAEAAAAEREPLAIVPPGHGIRAPHFVMYVRAQLLRQFGADAVHGRGLRVYTTLDLAQQERAEELLRRALADLNRGARAGRPARADSGAIVAIDVATGGLLVMVGSPDYFDERTGGAVNGVLARRQPGSAIKPITYAAAFERGLTAATMVTDVPAAFVTAEGEPYVPRNYDLTYHGPVLLREALASSYNVVAVKVLEQVGIDAMLDMARRLGITGFDSARAVGLAATLGGVEVSLLELTNAYAAFARGGAVLWPRAIDRVTDAGGAVLWQAPSTLSSPNDEAEPKQALSPQVAYLLSDVLSDDRARVPTFGEGSVLALSRPAAVKTGTTTDFRDNWTVGYTPQVAVGVWVGNADGTSMGSVSGVEGAAPVWRGVMELLHRRLPVQPFVEPPMMVRLEVCAESGLLPGPYCPHRRREVFIAGTEPTRVCDMHRLYRVDATTGYLADDDTPAGDVAERLYLVLPPDSLAWGDGRGIPRPPLPAPGAPAGDGERRAVVAIAEPPDNARYALAPDLPAWSQRLAFEAVVAVDAAIDSVRLVVDGETVAELGGPPYRVVWAPAVGEHRLWAEVTATDGRVWRSPEHRVTVVDGK